MNLEERLANSAQFLDDAIDRHVAGVSHGREPQRWHRRISIAAAAVLVVAGLGGVAMLTRGGNGTTQFGPATIPILPTPSVSSAPVQPDPGQTAPGPTVDAPSAEQLAVVFSLLGVSTPEDTAAFLSLNVDEARVAACMTTAGLQYNAMPDSAALYTDSPAYRMSAAQYAATYGFGTAAELLGLLPSGPADPNAEYRQSLGEDDQAAYANTLGGCRGMTDPQRVADSNALTVSVAEFRGRISSDLRVIDALATWRACMAGGGFQFDDPMQMRLSFQHRADEAVGNDQTEQQLADEIATATANVACEAVYKADVRHVVVERLAEFQELYDLALSSGVKPDGQG